MVQASDQEFETGDANPFAILKNYERRSLAHTVTLPEQEEVSGQWSGIGFRLGEYWLACAIDDVREILPLPRMTSVPGSAAWLLGVANIRGTLAAVVDLHDFLENVETRVTQSSRIVLVDQDDGVVGLLVDEVVGLRRFMDDEVAEEPVMEDSYLGPFVKREYLHDGTSWGIFNLEGLLRLPEFAQAAA